MEHLFKKIKSAFPKAIVQYEKNYVSFTFGGGLYYQLRVQKDKVRMMATNYPNKAKLGECLKIIRKNNIEGQEINGKEILFEIGVKNPEIFTLRLEMPYAGTQLENEKFNSAIVDSCAKFHEVLLPLVNAFLKQPVADLYSLMGGNPTPVTVKVEQVKDAPKKKSVKPKVSLQKQLADALIEHFPDAIIKKIDTDNYLDIHLPSVHQKKGTHLGINTAKGLIKIVFYCREDSFNELAISNSKKIELYAQGVRIKNNPTFNTVEKAVDASVNFVKELKRATINSFKNTNKVSVESKKQPIKQSVIKSPKEGNDFEEMIKAYKKGNFKKVADLVEKGNRPLQFNPDESVIENELIAVCAAEEVDLDVLKQIIKRGVDLDARNVDADQYTAVHYCAWDGKIDALSLLLENGASPDIAGGDGRTALHLATAMGHTDAVELLINAGVDLERRIPDGNKYYSTKGATALREALINQRWEVVDLLIEAGADISGLSEPCIESYKGEKDLFEVIKLLAEDGEYSDGNFDEEKLEELANRVQGVYEGDEQEEEENEGKENEYDDIDFDEFNVNEDSIINLICQKIKNGKYLTNLLYINKALSNKGYSVDRHQAYFFDSSVLISDRELEGFLVVNMDGFYSNCINETELSPIFSWSGVNDIEYEEDGDDSSIDIVADQGRLTIKKEGSHSLKILYTFYKNVWEFINDEFKDQSVIEWNQVWNMGINEVGFSEFNDYLTFDISQVEDENIEEDEELEEELSESEDEETNSVEELESDTEENEVEEDDEENIVEAEEMNSFHIGKNYEKQYLRFQEIADTTGILTNEIIVEPNSKERDELWDIVRAFVDRIYELDNEKTPDKNEINTLCFYAIVALHWCDLMINDKSFSMTNGRFRRDTIALALCLYARIDRTYDYYDHVKMQFIMPHMQFSVLLWSVNSIVNLGQDNLFGMFTQKQAEMAQKLFTDLDKKNQASGGFGVVAPDNMPDNHPLKAIWGELFTLFRNVRIPFQFVRNYISPEVPKRSFLKAVLSAKDSSNPGVTVTLLEEDLHSNLDYLDKQILHKQFPDQWNLFNDLAIIFIFFASTTDGKLSDDEKETIIQLISEWAGDPNQSEIKKYVEEAYDLAESEFNKDNSKERFDFALENIRRHFYVKFESDFEKTKEQLKLILNDLLKVAEADEVVETAEMDLIDTVKHQWGIQWGSEIDESDSEVLDGDEDSAEEETEYNSFIVSYLPTLTDDKVKYLLSRDKDLLLGSVTSLTDSQVELLSECTNKIYLDGLTSLTDKQAASFSKFKGRGISFDEIVSISDKQAEAFAKCKCNLQFNGITSLSENQTAYLASHIGDLSLNALNTLSDKQAEYLSKHQGELSLDGITNLTDKQVELLASHKGDLFLDSLTSLNDLQTELFSKHIGTLTLNGVTQLTEKQILLLSKHQGSLCLDGLVSLPDKAIEILSLHKGEYLSLSGLTSINDKVAQLLSKYDGDLFLNGVTTLSDIAAFEFSKFKGALSMDGLTSLSDKGAELLAGKGIYLKQEDESEMFDEEQDDFDIDAKISDFYCDNVWEREEYDLDKKSFPDVVRNQNDLDLLFRKFTPEEVDLIVNKIKKTKSYIILPFIKEILSREMDLSSFKPPFWFIPIVAYGNNISSILYFNQDGIYNTFKNSVSLSMVANVDVWKSITVEPGYNGLFDDDSDDNNLSSLKINWYNPNTGNNGTTNVVEFHGEENGASLKILMAIWNYAWKDVVDRSKGSSQFLLGPPPFLESFNDWDELIEWAKKK